MGWLTYFGGIALAVLTIVIYNVSDLVSVIYANHPSRLPSINTFRSNDILFPDVVRNCEDAIFDSNGGFLVLSCDPGRDTWNTVMGTFVNSTAPEETGLYFYDHSKSPNGRPEKLKLLDFRHGSSDFHPLGLDYHAPSNKLFVLNHAVSGHKIEVFKLHARDRAAAHIATLDDASLVTPNNIAAISENELFVTNDHFFPITTSRLLNTLETFSAAPLGSVIYVKLTADGTAIERTTKLARLPFANGVALLNVSTVAVSALTKPAVEIFDIVRSSSGDIDLVRKASVKVPFLADNLSVDGNGKLLIAGHPYPEALEKIARNQQFCHGPDAATDSRCQFERLSWVSEWSESEGLKTLYAGKGLFGTSTTAVRDVKTGVVYVVGLYEKGVLRWTE